MAGVAKGMREALPPCGVRPRRLRIADPRDLGKRSGPESARAAQPKPPCLPPVARGREEISLCGGEFSDVDVPGLGIRPETCAGLARGNSRTHGFRSNDREE